jgi:SAM-dependent methyltransferase
VVQARRRSFGSVADMYHRWRSSYPEELVDDVLARAPTALPRVLEVGAGTGKATLLFAPRALSLLAIEPDPEMAAVWRRECGGLRDVALEQIEFEHWQPDGTRFDLLISAMAWHWVAPDVRTVRAREALVAGGTLAVFWNQPVWEECALAERLTAAYEETVDEFRSSMGPMHPAHAGPPKRLGGYVGEFDRAHGFEAVEHRQYGWSREFTAGEYVALLGTHSDHIVLPENARRALFSAVEATIDRSGGILTLPYASHLSLARAT